MRHLYILLLAAILPSVSWGQADFTPIDADSMAVIDSDTASSIPEIGIVGDVLSGYGLTSTDNDAESKRFKMWQRDANGTPVRRIVVLKERWPNAPADILENPEAEEGSGDGGYKVVAVTEREYETLVRDSAIWGETWQVSYPWGISDQNRDTVPNRPGYEIVCYQKGREKAKSYGVESRKYSRELMVFHDTLPDGKVIPYLCAAANLRSMMADYTPGSTGYKYGTRWMFCSPEESDYWLEKWKAYQREEALDDGYLRSYRDWLIGIEGEGRKKATPSLFRPTGSSRLGGDEDIEALRDVVIGNVLSGYMTVALPYDGQRDRFRWFWTDSVGTLGQQIIVLDTTAPNLPDSVKANGDGLALASVSVEAYVWFRDHGLLWGECWEVTPVEGGFEFVCLKKGSEWMQEGSPDYAANSRELSFYTWDSGKRLVPIPAAMRNRKVGEADHFPLYFPVRMVNTDVKRKE